MLGGFDFVARWRSGCPLIAVPPGKLRHPERRRWVVQCETSCRVEFQPVKVQLPDRGLVFRSLETADLEALGTFYGGLSARTREFWHRQANARTLAREHCDAIDRFDKLRLVADDGIMIVAVFELSFSIPKEDHERFAVYGLSLDERTDARFGPCVRDDEHGSGLAPRLFAETARIAWREGRSRLILWGGVQHENHRARRFYEREGFSEVGRTGSIIDMVRPI